MKLSHSIYHEVLLSLAVLALLGVLINPYWMPMGVIIVLLIILTVLIFGFGVFIWKESPKDEREYGLMSQTGRYACLIAGAIMTIGMSVQIVRHEMDIWLLLALGSMIFTKVATSIHQKM